MSAMDNSCPEYWNKWKVQREQNLVLTEGILHAMPKCIEGKDQRVRSCLVWMTGHLCSFIYCPPCCSVPVIGKGIGKDISGHTERQGLTELL